MKTKYCKYCDRHLELTCFCKHPSTRDLLSNKCRKCQSAYHKRRNSTDDGKEAQKLRMERWYANPDNKQKMIDRAAAYKKNNPEKIKQQYVTRTTQYSEEDLQTLKKSCNTCKQLLPLIKFSKGDGKFGRATSCTPCAVEKQRQRDKQNPEAARERNRKRYQANKEYYRERSKVYRQQNWERIKQTQNRWRRDSGKNSEYTQKRRSIKRSAFVAPVPWNQLKKHFNNCCAYCGESGKVLTMDHVIPLSRGGTHEPKNVVPACVSCNSRKYTHTLEELGWTVRNP